MHTNLSGICTVYQIQRGKVCKHIGEVTGQTPVELLHYKNLNIPSIYCNILKKEWKKSSMPEETFAEFLSRIDGLEVEEQWTTSDVRPGRGEEKWLNLILRKR